MLDDISANLVVFQQSIYFATPVAYSAFDFRRHGVILNTRNPNSFGYFLLRALVRIVSQRLTQPGDAMSMSADDVRLAAKLLAVPVLIVSLFILPVVLVFRHQRVVARRKEMALLAAKLSLPIVVGRDERLAAKYVFLDRLGPVADGGASSYALNVIAGSYEDRNITVFDYRYKSGNSVWFWAPSWNRPKYLSFVIVKLEKAFPELTIAREGFFSKMGQAIGFDDIDFESNEFSENFVVRSKDKKFAYDFCNAKMIDYLLDRSVAAIEVEKKALALGDSGLPSSFTLEQYINHLLKIRSLMPNYLFAS